MERQKEKILEDWVAIRNAIIRAESGELLVKYMRESDFIVSEGDSGEAAAVAQSLKDSNKDKVIGIYVDLVLKFPESMDREFTAEEINDIKQALSAIESAQTPE